jgi:hypothetical protein
MAVDFSLLPMEMPETGKPPSRLLWMVVFLLLVLAGIVGVLLIWPKNLSTHTFSFWGTLVLYPVGIPALIVLFRFQHYAARKLDIQMSNRAARQYNEGVFAAASVPLAVLGASHRFSVVSAENAIAGIQSGTLRLPVQELLARDSEPARVRWLDVPGVRLGAGIDEDDRKRQEVVTRWLFGEILEELAEAITALPVQASLRVHLLVSGMLTDLQNEALWQECWSSCRFRPASVARLKAEPRNLQLVDAWLDQIAGGHEHEAKLIVAVQLHALLGGSPRTGTAEAGVALLLMPDALASQYGISRMANLHRPVRGPFDLSNDALAHALKWASLTTELIPGGWRTGIDMTQAGALYAAALQAGLDIQPVDIDPRVGHAGIAAPWLATACAARTLCAGAPSQIVFAGAEAGVDCAVLREATGENPVTVDASANGVAVERAIES